MKILVPVDGSQHSLDVIKWVVKHAKAYREAPTVELVYVNPPVPKLWHMGLAVGKNQIQAYYEEEGKLALSSAKVELGESGLEYTDHILIGPIAESIVLHSQKAGCDLIALASRGMGAAGNLLLGSTTTKVLHLSTVPVFVVK
jgi:nucleotide-binding universal stress UspA family protein